MSVRPSLMIQLQQQLKTLMNCSTMIITSNYRKNKKIKVKTGPRRRKMKRLSLPPLFVLLSLWIWKNWSYCTLFVVVLVRPKEKEEEAADHSHSSSYFSDSSPSSTSSSSQNSLWHSESSLSGIYRSWDTLIIMAVCRRSSRWMDGWKRTKERKKEWRLL